VEAKGSKPLPAFSRLFEEIECYASVLDGAL